MFARQMEQLPYPYIACSSVRIEMCQRCYCWSVSVNVTEIICIHKCWVYLRNQLIHTFWYLHESNECIKSGKMLRNAQSTSLNSSATKACLVCVPAKNHPFLSEIVHNLTCLAAYNEHRECNKAKMKKQLLLECTHWILLYSQSIVLFSVLFSYSYALKCPFCFHTKLISMTSIRLHCFYFMNCESFI